MAVPLPQPRGKQARPDLGLRCLPEGTRAHGSPFGLVARPRQGQAAVPGGVRRRRPGLESWAGSGRLHRSSGMGAAAGLDWMDDRRLRSRGGGSQSVGAFEPLRSLRLWPTREIGDGHVSRACAKRREREYPALRKGLPRDRRRLLALRRGRVLRRLCGHLVVLGSLVPLRDHRNRVAPGVVLAPLSSFESSASTCSASGPAAPGTSTRARPCRRGSPPLLRAA